jgi:hypothetical protein
MQIWILSNTTNAGRLNEKEFYISLRLVALAQQGLPLSLEAALKPASKMHKKTMT